MAKTVQPTIYHIVGLPGSGKSTFCRLLFEGLVKTSILAVDPSRDNFLALSYGLSHNPSLVSVLENYTAVSVQQEAVDCLFQELPISIHSEADTDVLWLGAFDQPLPETPFNAVNYGMPRLLSDYELVVWDGPLGEPIPIFGAMEFSKRRRIIWVVTPDTEQDVLESTIETLVSFKGAGPAYVVYSKAEATTPLPDKLLEAIQSDSLKFIGKVPPIQVDQTGVSALSDFMKDCLYKLDFPFELTDRLP